ncbi:MAG: hexose kinase [Candidatus Limnocylindrales bacterium]
MIRVVGANPAMDRISTWPPLRLGGVNRAVQVSVVPGGKGFNVARAALRLGTSAVAYGFLGGDVGEALRGLITEDGVVDRHTAIAAGTRVCFVVVEPDEGRTTVLNEPGPPVTEAEVGRFLDDIRADTGPDDLLVISGSLPDSVSSSVVAEVLAIGREAGARTVVDIHSEALRVAFASRPWMLKCNRRELLELLGAPDLDATTPRFELASQMQRIRDHGIEVVVVTMGAEGALLADAEGAVHALAPRVTEVNPTGSGDLFLAGLMVGVEAGQRPRDAIAWAVACGTAGATHLPPELPPGFRLESWLRDVAVETVSEAG